MDIRLERYHRIIKDLKELKYHEKQAINLLKRWEGKEGGSYEVAYDDGHWASYQAGEIWSRSSGEYSWFRTAVVIPASMNHRRVRFRISTGHQEGWDISNPQFLIYVNGQLVQGLDVNHTETVMALDAVEGETYQVTLLANSNLNSDAVIFKAWLVADDTPVHDFYYDVSNLFWTACTTDDTNARVRMFADLDSVMDCLDLRRPRSESFYESIEEATKLIRSRYYDEINRQGPIVTTLGHTHIDVAWLWTVEQTKEKVIRSFSTVLYLMDLYPSYKFMSSQPQLYEFLLEEAPELFERVKEKVREGRWEVDGGMWLEADCNIPSGESLVRQFLYGTAFIKEHFGNDCTTLWLPDVFGYSAALPQLIKKSGLTYFMTTKLDWNQFNKVPNDTFMWRGIDGTEVLTHLITTTNAVHYDGDIYRRENLTPNTTYNGRLNPNQVMGTWTKYKNKSLTDETFQVFGFGDGGGGPTEEMLENYERLKYGLPGIPRTSMDFQRGYFKRLAKSVASSREVGSWQGELYFENHRGTYTSMAKNKLFNRQGEFLYQDIEFIATLAEVFGFKYPQKAIEAGWKILLLNQFHDIIPGTSIKEVYDQTDIEYAELMKKGDELLNEAMASIAEKICDQEGVLVFNTLSQPREDVLKLNEITGRQPLALRDDEGVIYPLFVSDEEGAYEVNVEGIPPKSYKYYTFVYDGVTMPVQDEKATKTSILMADKDGYRAFSNQWYDVVFDDAMTLTRLYDKVNNCEILKEGGRGNVLQLFEDRPSDFENWNIDYSFKDKIYEIDDVTDVKVTVDNSIKTTILIYRTYGESTIEQRIHFYKAHQRIDFETTADWHEQQVLLKAAFDVDINAQEASYEIQYGQVKRSNHENTSWDKAQFEVCGHKWADVSEGGYGVSLLNDCKYGYDIKDSLMRLTLIKCGTYPNPEADQGHHSFTYALLPHEGQMREDVTIKHAYELNVPFRYIYTDKGDAARSKVANLMDGNSFVKVDAANIVIDTIKKQENGTGTVIRLFENMNKRTRTQLIFSRPIRSICSCNLLETEAKKIPFKEYDAAITLKPFEVVTYIVEFDQES